MNSAECLRLHL